VNIDYLYYDENANIQKIKRTTTGVDKVNNALVENGTYRLTVSHSALSLVEENGIVVQRPESEKDANQFWTVERSAKNARHYTLKNYGTGRYYCPPKTLLDTVKTSATACEIRIENASAAKGYYLYGDYDSDFVGDVLNVSKDSGMPVITWVRTGADNQKVKLAKATPPAVEPESSSSVEESSSSEVAESSSSSEVAPESSSSGTTAIAPRAARQGMQVPARKGYRDLKGRSFDRRIPYRVMF
jgi:hypothetical protein